MKSIVIIHGLASKPAVDTLARRYRKYLNEGVGTEISESHVHTVYWADLMGYAPVTAASDEYVEGANNFRELSGLERSLITIRSQLRKRLKDAVESNISEYLDPNQPDRQGVIRDIAVNVFGRIVNRKAQGIYERFLPDLDRYFNKGSREPVKRRLTDVLDGTVGEVCVIAHSMGSIVALDVLLHEQHTIDRLITIGSPLGIKVVQNHLLTGDASIANLKDKLGTWHNFYDRLDVVALDHDLNDDYHAVQIEDEAVENLFVDAEGNRNHHKSYGYLRAPALGGVVRSFLQGA